MEDPHFEDPEEGVNAEQPLFLTDKEKKRLEKTERDKKELINRVASGSIHNLRDRVAYILNQNFDSRNSDIELAWSYWRAFEPGLWNGVTVTKENLIKLTKLPSLIRSRAKIQNEYNLFLADEEVRQHRGVLRGDFQKQAVDDKPTGLGSYIVYIDETGKTQPFLSVGSLWVLEGGPEQSYATLQLSNWKKDNAINYEFHFAELKKQKLDNYKAFFTKFISLNPSVGFKVIVMNNHGVSDQNGAITDLTFHILDKGIRHEHGSGRAPLPRRLQVYLDEESKGSDELKIANVKERIAGQRLEGLILGDFFAVPSTGNFYIQIIDLFTGAINRKLHYPEGDNFKDEFADFVLRELGFDISQIDTANNRSDNSTVFNLRQ